MTEEAGKNRGVTVDPEGQYPYGYGTFQGVANYYPPSPQPPPHPVVGFPQPVLPPDHYRGYQNTATGYVVIEGSPTGRGPLSCCGMGMGWFLFIVGFFLGGIPWYVGAFVLLFAQLDYREKPGYVACAIASILALIAVTLGVTKGAHNW